MVNDDTHVMLLSHLIFGAKIKAIDPKSKNWFNIRRGTSEYDLFFFFWSHN